MNMNNLGLEICPKLRSQFVFPYHLDWNNSIFKYSWMLKWIWNMQSIAILLSHDVCLPLKRKLGFNDKLIGLFKKKISGWIGLGSNPDWDVVQIIQIKCIPVAIQISSKPGGYGFRVAKLVQKRCHSSCKIGTKRTKNNISNQNPSCWITFIFIFYFYFFS